MQSVGKDGLLHKRGRARRHQHRKWFDLSPSARAHFVVGLGDHEAGVRPAPVVIVRLDPVGIEAAAIDILEEILPPSRKRDIPLPGIAFPDAPCLISLKGRRVAAMNGDRQVKPAIAKDRLPGALDRFIPGQIPARHMNEDGNRVAARLQPIRNVMTVHALERRVRPDRTAPQRRAIEPQPVAAIDRDIEMGRAYRVRCHDHAAYENPAIGALHRAALRGAVDRHEHGKMIDRLIRQPDEASLP